MKEPWAVFEMKNPGATKPQDDCTNAPSRKGKGCSLWRTPSSELSMATIQMIMLLPVLGGMTIGFFIVLGGGMGKSVDEAETNDNYVPAPVAENEDDTGSKENGCTFLGFILFLTLIHCTVGFLGNSQLNTW